MVHLTTVLYFYFEQVTGIEPASEAWKATVLTVVLHLLFVAGVGVEPTELGL